MMPKNNIRNLPREMHFSPGKPPVKVIDLTYSRHDDVVHTHDFYEIVLVKNGSGRHITDKSSSSIVHGDIFLIKPGEAHAYEEIEKLRIVNVIFLSEAINFNLYDLKDLPGYKFFFESSSTADSDCFKGTFNLDVEQLSTANEIILEMIHHQQKEKQGYEYFIRLGLMRLIGLLCISYLDVGVPQNNDVAKIICVLRFIEHHYLEKIKIDELAAISNMSPSTLLRTFHRELGETPINYLINRRLQEAAKRLRSTNENISEISFACGFQDSNYFSKIFRRKYTCSPRQYRNANPNIVEN